MNAAGYGDAIAMYTGPADWYLASLVGMDDSYHPAPVAMLLEGGQALLDGAAALRRRDPEALDRLARMLTLGGIAIGAARTTAVLSGTEHLVSHLLDIKNGKRGLPLAFHGAQVGVATVVVAAAWRRCSPSWIQRRSNSMPASRSWALWSRWCTKPSRAWTPRGRLATSVGATTARSWSGGGSIGKASRRSSRTGPVTGPS